MRGFGDSFMSKRYDLLLFYLISSKFLHMVFVFYYSVRRVLMTTSKHPAQSRCINRLDSPLFILP
jgi:hypothetical protein